MKIIRNTRSTNPNGQGLVKNFALASVVVGLAVASTGCATKGHVNRELATLRSEMQAGQDEMRGAMAEMRNSVDQALARGEAASGLAGEARDLALGKHGYREVARYTVPFDFNGDEMTAEEAFAIDEIAARLQAHPEYVVDLFGYTDSVGPTRYNYELGRRRAEAVMRSLAERVPGSLHRFASVSFGESGSEGWTGDESDRRRVEVSLIERSTEKNDTPPDGTISMSN